MTQLTRKEPPHIIREMMRAYIEKVNDARDNHISRLTYEQCLEGRYGMVEGMKAVYKMLEAHFEDIFIDPERESGYER